MESKGLSNDEGSTVATSIQNLLRQHGMDSRVVGAPYATDATAIAASGVPSIVFGPGSIDQAHTADEFIEIAQLQLGTEIFYQIARNGLRALANS
jgi:acetylornithine deacetylase/succinyl-diaminopimelate desuccinylase-like protein